MQQLSPWQALSSCLLSFTTVAEMQAPHQELISSPLCAYLPESWQEEAAAAL